MPNRRLTPKPGEAIIHYKDGRVERGLVVYQEPPAPASKFIVQRRLSGSYVFLRADRHWTLERSEAERFPTREAAARKRGNQPGKIVSCL